MKNKEQIEKRMLEVEERLAIINSAITKELYRPFYTRRPNLCQLLDLEKKIRNTQADLDQNKADQLKEAQAPASQDPKVAEKSLKHKKSLISDESSLQSKLTKYQTQLDQNKKQQQLQESSAGQEQHSLDSLKSLRKN